MKASLRTYVATLVGSLALTVSSAAFAAGEPCFNDTDCPGGTECGGDVCDWNQSHAMPDGRKAFVCVAAGSTGSNKGSEGWCETDANCKCAAQGAKCVAPYCSFTQAKDAPAGTAGSGSGGSSSGTAGMPSTAGTGTAGSGTAGTASTPAKEDEGGCSIGVPGGKSSGLALGLGIAALGWAFARRRRS